LPDHVLPQPRHQYIDDASEENQRVKQEVLAFLKTAIPN